jgi:hypothetical protein
MISPAVARHAARPRLGKAREDGVSNDSEDSFTKTLGQLSQRVVHAIGLGSPLAAPSSVSEETLVGADLTFSAACDPETAVATDGAAVVELTGEVGIIVSELSALAARAAQMEERLLRLSGAPQAVPRSQSPPPPEPLQASTAPPLQPNPTETGIQQSCNDALSSNMGTPQCATNGSSELPTAVPRSSKGDGPKRKVSMKPSEGGRDRVSGPDRNRALSDVSGDVRSTCSASATRSSLAIGERGALASLRRMSLRRMSDAMRNALNATLPAQNNVRASLSARGATSNRGSTGKRGSWKREPTEHMLWADRMRDGGSRGSFRDRSFQSSASSASGSAPNRRVRPGACRPVRCCCRCCARVHQPCTAFVLVPVLLRWQVFGSRGERRKLHL